MVGPLCNIYLVGLRNYNFNDTAEELKKRWIALNDKVFKETVRRWRSK
jgi:alpha,alpha-trehalase